MSEEIGEQLFLQGCNSDGILPWYYPDTYIQIMDNYSRIVIRKEYEVDDKAHEALATAEPQFVFIMDYDIKKLKVDELRR